MLFHGTATSTRARPADAPPTLLDPTHSPATPPTASVVSVSVSVSVVDVAAAAARPKARMSHCGKFQFEGDLLKGESTLGRVFATAAAAFANLIAG